MIFCLCSAINCRANVLRRLCEIVRHDIRRPRVSGLNEFQECRTRERRRENVPLCLSLIHISEAALFARFITTMSRSDFSITLIIGYGLRPSRRGPGHVWWGQRWRSPGSRSKGFCACQGLRRRGAGSCLAMTTRTILPSVGRKTSTPRTCLTPLNTCLLYTSRCV